MESHREKNFQILRDRYPGIYKKIAKISFDEAIRVVETKKGDYVPAIKREGRDIFIHSRFDPVKEAERFISEISSIGHNLFIVFGFGFAYHIEELLRDTPEDSMVIVIERDPAVLLAAVTYRDLTAELKNERLLILLAPDDDEVTESLAGKSSKSVSFITHRGCYRLYPHYYSNMLEGVRSRLSTKDVNIATLAKFEKIWNSNIARNIRYFLELPGAGIFYNRFRGIPAIVAAAGPSLTKSIDFIREKENKCIIIAVDTAFGILLKNGIEPHFCITVDPQVINARYFEGLRYSKTLIVADPTVHPSVFHFCAGRAVTTSVAFNIMKWIEWIAGEKGEITHGGSVSTNAYDFARRLGAGPLIMVGQDLAFTGGYAHARGSYLDEEFHLRTDRLNNVQMFNRRQLTALPKILVKGIKSEKVHTNQKMMIFISWFEKTRDENLINAGYDGAFIRGIRHEAAENIKIEKSSADIDSVINNIYENNLISGEDLANKKERLLKRIGEMIKESDSLLPHIENAVNLSENLLSLIEKDQRDQNKVDYILKKLSKIDELIESKENIKDMISLTIQKVIHTINEGYEIDDNDRDLDEDSLAAKRSGYLYKGLLEGALFNRKILGKMYAILEGRLF